MKIKIWGTRGSIPTPSTLDFSTILFGGDTTCVSIEFGQHLIILDAGSGIRHLGQQMIQQGRTKAALLFSHLHWDHIQGFPFFAPAFSASFTLDLYGKTTFSDAKVGENLLQQAILSQQHIIHFPVPLQEMGANIQFHEFQADNTLSFESPEALLHVSCAPIQHPGGCLGYRFEQRRHIDGLTHTFAFFTDTEHQDDLLQTNVQTLARNVDLMLYDGQYTEEQFMQYRGWGHSTWKHGLREALAAGVERLLISHHDPRHDDTFLLQLEKEARTEAHKHGIHLSFARQFQTFDLS